MILTLSYHSAYPNKYGNDKDLLKKHLEYIAKTYPTLFPSEPFSFFKTDICLTFDDGYFDFYHIVYPLLKRLNLKATLAVCPAYIVEKTDLPPSIRLSTHDHFSNFKKTACFCTWDELYEMVRSPFVQIASHSYTHADLTKAGVDLQKEIIDSKAILEKKLQTQIDTFVYPYGKFSKKVHEIASKHYKVIMRLGTSLNFSWKNLNNLHYRVPADNLDSYKDPFNSYFSYFFRYIFNSIRRR